jgi:tRNA threonylcarbamoyladenosine modification (KEOPS) complex  Pcc1 subunit
MRLNLVKAKATVRLQFPSEKQLETVMAALAPEANAPVNRRSKVAFAKEGNYLALTVEAKDTVALRAALNAYLRWIGSTAKILKVLAKSQD